MMDESNPILIKYGRNDDNASKVVAAIHPLTTINISDHFTRINVSKENQYDLLKVMGVLLGTKTELKTTIVNSFELKIDVSEKDGEIDFVIDSSYLNKKLEQVKIVFPNLSVIGWYSIGKEPSQNELDIQKEYITNLYESPLFLQYEIKTANSASKGVEQKINPHNRTELPLKVYETLSIEGQDKFVEIHDYFIETDATQRISLEVMHQSTASSTKKQKENEGVGSKLDKSSFIANVNKQNNAISILTTRVKKVVKYLDDVESGKLTPNPVILRQINSVISKLPSSKGTKFKQSEMASAYASLLDSQYFNSVIKTMDSFGKLASISATKENLRKRIESINGQSNKKKDNDHLRGFNFRMPNFR